MSKNSESDMETQDAISLLTADHKKVQQLFQEFEEMKDDEEMEDEKSEIVEQICQELTIHAQLEEEIFYPAMREAIEDNELMDEADVEHDTAKYLISQLESMETGDDHFEAKVSVLGELVNHHIKEEQDQIFSKAKKADVDLDELGQMLQQRKQELMEDMGVEVEPMEASSGSKKQKSDKKKSERSHRPGAH